MRLTLAVDCLVGCRTTGSPGRARDAARAKVIRTCVLVLERRSHIADVVSMRVGLGGKVVGGVADAPA